ncbi:MAG: quinolinate synthase NadA [Deltaproteobacteria bacterium]|nr:quinolinate synthase NadA [Deltaproteobacteria bacterium]
MNDNNRDIEALSKKVRKLLKDKNAILLAHNYQIPEVQDVADICGDSLELSIKASKTEADIIVFCGVHFMAETAAILSPDKTVLLPVVSAGCPMADMITARQLQKKKSEMPDAVIVSYVNTTAEVKAESDMCCTSANAVSVARSIDREKRIYMTPDRNLAQYTLKTSGRNITWWNGYCPIHNNLTAGQVKKVKAENPGALLLAHPECPPEVLDLADEVKSTSGMLSFVKNSEKTEFIIGTETGIIHPLKKANPGKRFIPADPAMICVDMKKTRLEDIIISIQEMRHVIKVPEEIRVRAKTAVERMLAVPVD